LVSRGLGERNFCVARESIARLSVLATRIKFDTAGSEGHLCILEDVVSVIRLSFADVNGTKLQ